MLNSLLQKEIEEIEENEEVKADGFKIENLEGANWCFRKIRALQVKMIENKMLADSERVRIATWEKKENESIQDNISYFQSLLTNYFKKEKEKDKKFKLSTPYGKVTARKSKKWLYEDEDQVIKYLKESEYSQLIRVKEEINKSELKKIFKDGVNVETGEVIPGISIEETESISVKVE